MKGWEKEEAVYDGEDIELRARLKQADPASFLPPLGPERVAALLDGATAPSAELVHLDEARAGRRQQGWLVAAAAAVVLIGVGAFVATDPGQDEVDLAAPEPEQTELVLPTAVGKCLPATAEAVADKELVFAGTVTAVTDSAATLVPTDVYAGAPSDTVSVIQPPSSPTLDGGFTFTVGEAFLIAATGGQVVGCGLSGPATPALQTLYAEAFAQ